MDTGRLLILAWAGVGLSGCALLGEARPTPSAWSAVGPGAASPGRDAAEPSSTAAPGLPAPETPVGETENGGEPDGEPNVEATGEDVRIGEVQVYAWSPGRVYPVRTAPLRVTTLTLPPGETLLAKAAGDTVRWQIGEASSGAGALGRTHVMIKPLQRGLETNLVLTTTRRVYLIDLSSGGADRFNIAVEWDVDPRDGTAPSIGASAVAVPDGPLEARYRIEPQGRRPRWTPTSVFNDGRRTFIAFDADLAIDEAPALFVIAPDGEAQMVNYRQAGGLFIVDRVFDRAELRLGDRRPQVVRLRRLAGAGR